MIMKFANKKLVGIGDWGLGIGDWPNPQSPIPNPQSPKISLKYSSSLLFYFIISVFFYFNIVK
jgi:hypothetical protein